MGRSGLPTEENCIERICGGMILPYEFRPRLLNPFSFFVYAVDQK